MSFVVGTGGIRGLLLPFRTPKPETSRPGRTHIHTYVRTHLGEVDEPGLELVAEVGGELPEVVGLPLQVQLLPQDVRQLVLLIDVWIGFVG